jgi:hypothetical protein
MKNKQEYVEKLISSNPRMRDIPMNSFEYRLIMLMAEYIPTNSKEYGDIVEAITCALYGLVMAVISDPDKRKAAFNLLHEEWMTALKEEVKNA